MEGRVVGGMMSRSWRIRDVVWDVFVEMDTPLSVREKGCAVRGCGATEAASSLALVNEGYPDGEEKSLSTSSFKKKTSLSI